MKYKIVHVTQYVYSEPVTLCHNQAHLTPRESARQRCISCQLDIRPTPSVTQPWRDAFGNVVTYFSIEQPHRELSVVAQSQVESRRASLPPTAAASRGKKSFRESQTPTIRRIAITPRCSNRAGWPTADEVRAYALAFVFPRSIAV